MPHISGAETIERVIDLEHNRKVKSSAGYEHWAKLHNLQIQAKTFNILSDNGLLDVAKLDEALAAVTSAFRSSKEGLKSTDSRLQEVNHQLRLLGQYYSTKQVYREYRSSKKKLIIEMNIRQNWNCTMLHSGNSGRSSEKINCRPYRA